MSIICGCEKEEILAMGNLSCVRQEKILDILRQDKQIRIRPLIKEFGVTTMTIRRDLKALEKKGMLVCVHGGAVPPEDNSGEMLFSKRKVINADLKNAIGYRAAQLVHPGSNIFVDGSTTAVAFVKYLKKTTNLCVVTDSLSVFFELQTKPFIQTILLGGMLQTDRNTLSGTLTLDNLSKMVFDYCFFSTAGYTLEGIYNVSPTGVETKRTAILNAKHRVLLADSTKYNRKGSWQICQWDQIDTMVTDKGIDNNLIEKLRGVGVDVLTASTSHLPDV